MNIFDIKGETEHVSEVNKPIGSIIIYTTADITELTDEKINLQVQKNGNNLEITGGNVYLRDLVQVATMGQDALGFNKTLECKLQAMVELCNHGAIHLEDKDLIRIQLSDLNPENRYIIDGIEEPWTSNEVYKYEQKSMNTEHREMDFNTKSFDSCVFSNDEKIYEVVLNFDNGHIAKYTPRELRAMGENLDPIAKVNIDGTVTSSFENNIQLPLKGIDMVTIRKNQGSIVNFLMRHDVTQQYHAPVAHSQNVKLVKHA